MDVQMIDPEKTNQKEDTIPQIKCGPGTKLPYPFITYPLIIHAYPFITYPLMHILS